MLLKSCGEVHGMSNRYQFITFVRCACRLVAGSAQQESEYGEPVGC
jgi:hypothetical protein